jgi:hypothetical protein
MVEVRSSQMGLGEGAYLYAITTAGITRAREALDRSQYAGPAPVPLDIYNDSVRRQSRGRVQVTSRHMRQVVNDRLLARRPFHAWVPLSTQVLHFHLRSSGKRKDQCRRAIGNLILSQTMYIPYSIYVDGQVITVFDSVNHQLAPEDETGPTPGRGGMRKDVRWIRIRSPLSWWAVN